MQESSCGEGSNLRSDAEKEHQENQELMAITAFCHAQKAHIQALHDNVARVYGKAGELTDTCSALSSSHIFC